MIEMRFILVCCKISIVGSEWIILILNAKIQICERTRNIKKQKCDFRAENVKKPVKGLVVWIICRNFAVAKGGI
ncbi:MAG: hypothetical protein ACI30W_00885, partial [Muribaculaceae bacterium]